MAKESERKIAENKVQKPEGLLTVKEYRSKLAGVLKNKRKRINEESDKIQHDESLSDEEKEVKLSKLYEELHEWFRQNAVAKFDNGDYYDDREYRVIYVKNFQIKEIERQLKDEKDPEKRQILEEKLKYIKDFYESEKCLDRNHDAEMEKIIEEMKSKNEWIDWLRWKWENELYDGKTIDEICNIISQYWFIYYWDIDNGERFVEKIKTMNDGSYEKFIQSVVDGWWIKVDNLWKADSYPYWAWYPEVFEKIWWLKERQSYELFCNGSTESEERLQKELEAIQKTWWLKEGCTVTIDFWLCSWTSKHHDLIKWLIDEANKKWINSTIWIWYDNPHGDDTYKSYNSCYWGDFGIKDIVKKNRERITQRKKNKMDGKPVLEIDDNYNDIELTEENLKNIIDTEWKKLKDSILYDYDVYKEKETAERVKSRIDSFLDGALKFCSKQVGMTPKMAWWMVLWIWGKILEVYKHPYYLNWNTKDPAFTIDSFDLWEEWLIIKTRYTTWTSWTWVWWMKLDDPDYSTQTYLVTKDWKCEHIDQWSYNMRDLYK